MHLHLDVVGGISGDMFASAMLDVFPELGDDLEAQVTLAGFPELVELSSGPFDDGILTGTRFYVTADKDAEGHHHRHYSEIRDLLQSSRLDASVKERALDIFRILAEAEASIHGKSVETVAFHEVGAWDSIADVVCAAYLADRSGADSFSCSDLPLGSGQVNSAHGRLPVPAPATSLILQGFTFFDDGLKGERITPTGAAILKHLTPDRRVPRGSRLLRGGYGFGSKKFPGISNTLRISAFEVESIDLKTRWQEDQILIVEFEIDDQTPEELSDSLERLRKHVAVIDILQYPVLGKKGRQGMAIRVLARVDHEDAAITACFRETTTLGIRKRYSQRSILDRSQVTIDGQPVKVANRQGESTAKMEMDAVSSLSGTLADRRIIRSQLEHEAENIERSSGDTLDP